MTSRLKKVRKARGLTQVQVAQRAQVSYRGYQEIESGNRVPNVLSAQRIASVLSTTVDDIFPVFEDAKTENQEEKSPVNQF